MSRGNDRGRFVEVVSGFRGLWNSIDIRILCASIEGEWHNLATSCYLDSRLVERIPRFLDLPATAHLRALHVVLDIQELSRVLDQAGGGLLELQEGKVHCVRLQGSDARQPYSTSDYSFLGLPRARARASREWACHRLVAAGDSIDSLLNKLPLSVSDLDDLLRALPHPWDGVDGLASAFLGEGGLVGSSRSAIIQVVAPLRARLDPSESYLRDGQLNFAVVAESQALAHLTSIGYVGNRHEPPPLAGNVQLADGDWIPHDSLIRCKGNLELGGVPNLVLFLRVGDSPVDRLLLFDPARARFNPRIEAYRVFDPDLEVLRDWLGAARPGNSSALERCVARLLTLSGFSVDALSGDSRLGDAVDLIAYADPDMVVLALECTVGAIDAGGKLGKLVARARAIQSILQQHEVLPVLVTALSRDMISEAEMRAAADDSVIVVGQEDLSRLLETLSEGPSLQRAIGFLRSRTASTSRFPLGGRI